MNKSELDFKIALQNNIGLIKAGIWNGTSIDMGHGGTGAALVPTQGGLVVTNASTMSILGPGELGQILKSQGTTAAPAWAKAPEDPKPGNWGSFWDNTSQAATANTPTPMLFCITDPSSTGVFLSNGSRINIVNSGVYNIQFSAQFQNVANNIVHDTTIWLRINGVDVPDTAGFVSVEGQHSGTPGSSLPAWNYILPMSAGDYVEIYYHVDDTALSLVTLPVGVSPVHPSSPAVIATVQQVMGTQGLIGLQFPPSYVTSVNGLTGAVTQIAKTSDNLSQFSSTTSDQLRGVISNETGSGALVFATSPTLVTPVLGTPASGTLTNCTGVPNAATTATALANASTIVLRDANADTAVRDLACRDINSSRNLVANDAMITATVTADTVTATTAVSALMVTGNSSVLVGAKVLDYNTQNLCLTLPSGKGVIPSVQIICPSAATSLASSSTAQNVFSPTGYDVITVSGTTTYRFQGLYIIKTTGTTTHTGSISFALNGGATATHCSFTTTAFSHTAPPVAPIRAQDFNVFLSTTGGVAWATNNTACNTVKIEGILRINTGGTVTPQLTFSAAPGGTNTLEIGSYLEFYPIGVNTMNSFGTAIG